MTSNLDAALAYAGRGWRVFPVKPDKAPYTRRGHTMATVDAVTLRRWWAARPAAGIGVACGPSGLVVVDLDVKGDANGVESLAEVADSPDRFGQAMATRTVGTRSGGLHLIYTAPDARVRSRNGRWPGVDVKAHGGYVVAPPTPGYEVLDDRDPEPVPGWLLEHLVEEERPEGPTGWDRLDAQLDSLEVAGGSRSQAWFQAALAGCALEVAQEPPGTRNDKLNRVTYRLAAYVLDGALDERHVVATMLRAGMAAGMPRAECEGTIRSALAGRRRGGAA